MPTGLKANADGSGAIQVGGSDAINITTGLNVGMGTSSPAQHLQVGNSTSATEMIRFASTLANFDVGMTASGCEVGTGNNQPIIFKTNAAERVRITELGLFQFNSGYGSVATAYGCRAWANFNGLLTGTNAPRAGGNVTSVTRTSAGIYTVNFTVAFPDTNYTMIATSGSLSPTSGFSIAMGNNAFTTSTAQIYTTNNVAANADNGVVGVAFFR